MATGAIINRKPQDLKNYPLALEISAERLDPEFLENIKKYGISTPIVICRSKKKELNGFIMKGHRRRMCAMKLQGDPDPKVAARFKTVPTLEIECNDRTEFERMLILDNVTNERTNSEKARMYDHLLVIEKLEVQAEEKRQRDKSVKDLAGKIDQAAENRKNADGSKSRDRAAAAVGLSTSAARKASEVVHHADELRNNGHVQEAEHLIETLDNESIAAAVEEMKAPEKKVNPESDAINRPLARLVSQMTGAKKTAQELFNAIDAKKAASPAFAQRHKRYEKMMRQLINDLNSVAEQTAAVNESWEGTLEQLDE